jgi:hypothetical protein
MRPFHNVTAKGMTVTYGETVSREKPSQSDWLRNCGNATWKHELCIDLLLWQEQITCKLLCLSLSNVTLHKLVALAPDFRITGKRLVAFMKASNNHLCFPLVSTREQREISNSPFTNLAIRADHCYALGAKKQSGNRASVPAAHCAQTSLRQPWYPCTQQLLVG